VEETEHNSFRTIIPSKNEFTEDGGVGSGSFKILECKASDRGEDAG
jgi:hypothetical protein